LAGFKNLAELSLAYCKVTDTGLRELAPLKNLTGLHVCGTKVTEAGIAALQKELPKCAIYR
jgi:internalin A